MRLLLNLSIKFDEVTESQVEKMVASVENMSSSMAPSSHETGRHGVTVSYEVFDKGAKVEGGGKGISPLTKEHLTRLLATEVAQLAKALAEHSYDQ